VLEHVTEIMEENRIMELNRSPILVFADDIAILGDTQEKVIETTKKLIQAGEKMELIISEEKTKCMSLQRGKHSRGIINNNNSNSNNIKVG